MPSTHTSGDHVSSQRLSSSSAKQRYWSSLSNDVLGEVYHRLPGPLSRARFAAACKSWRTAAYKSRRAAASANLPSRPLPWLMLDPCVGYKKRRFLYCPEDDAVLPRTPVRSGDPARGRFVGCHDGGWVAWSEPPFGILNLFSGAEIPLSPKQKRGTCGYPLLFRKIIFSEEPTSDRCIIAAITESRNRVAICAVGFPDRGWTLHEESVVDIAFCNGELYGLTDSSRDLKKFEIGAEKGGVPCIKNVHWLASRPNPWHSFLELYDTMYLVDLCGKIAVVVKRTRHPYPHNTCGPFFAVFKLAEAYGDGVSRRRFYEWEKLTSLDDHALFLGPAFSKAVHLPEDAHGCAQINHIYYSHPTQNNGVKKFSRGSNNNSHHGGRLFCKEDERIDNEIEGILSVGYYVRASVHPPMWIIPPDSQLRYRVKFA